MILRHNTAQCCNKGKEPILAFDGRRSQYDAAAIAFLLVDGQKRSARSSFENVVDTVAGQGTAFKVLPSADYLLHIATLLRSRESQ